MISKLKRWLPIVLLLGLLFVLIAWRLNVKRADVATQTGPKQGGAKMAPNVALASATVSDIIQSFNSVGSVEAPLNVKISPKVAGRIDYLQVHEGDRVTVGEVLVRIDPSQVDADVRQKQADLAEAQSRLAQAQVMQGSTNVGIVSQIQQQAAALASAQADYNQTRQNYSAQVATANEAITDAQNKVTSADASIANANAAINSAQANQENGKVKYSRASELYKKGYVAKQEVDDAETTLNVQAANVQVAQGQLQTALADKNSSLAQLQASKEQASIVKTTGKANIQAALAKVNQAKAALSFAKANKSQAPAYQQNLEALQSAVDSARAALVNSQAQRADTVLHSPLNGYVTGRLMDPGTIATPGQPVLELQSMGNVWVNIPVPEETSRKVHFGQPAQITFDALPGQTFNGKVIQINPSADPLSRQFTVRIGLVNPQNLVRPGMFGHVTMVLERVPGATVVPREAVTQKDGKASVLVVDKSNVAHERPVTLGASDANRFGITEGLQPGEKVIVMSARPVKDGQEVRTGGPGKGKGGGGKGKGKGGKGSGGEGGPQGNRGGQAS